MYSRARQNLHFSADFREAPPPATPLTARPTRSPNAARRLGASNVQRHEVHGAFALYAHAVNFILSFFCSLYN